MSEPADPEARRFPRWWWVVGLVLGLPTLFIGFKWARYELSSEGEYQRLVRRMWRHTQPVIEATRGAEFKTVARSRDEAVRVVHSAVANHKFSREPDGTHARLRRIVDRLDATRGAELADLAGCYRLVDECEREFADLADYYPLIAFREMQKEGLVLPLTAQ